MYAFLSTGASLSTILIWLIAYLSKRKIHLYLQLRANNGDFQSFSPPNSSDVKFLILTLVITTVLAALISIISGHYSRAISEHNSNWLLIPLIWSYIYLVIVPVAWYMLSNFSMSGYR